MQLNISVTGYKEEFTNTTFECRTRSLRIVAFIVPQHITLRGNSTYMNEPLYTASFYPQQVQILFTAAKTQYSDICHYYVAFISIAIKTLNQN